MGRIPKAIDEKINHMPPPVPPQRLPSKHTVKAPRLSKNFQWSDIGKTYWKRIWDSPMAVTFIEADLPGLERMTMLHEIIHMEVVTQGILSELRQLEDRFGMSPLARRRLQWDIDRANGLHEKPKDEQPADDDRFLRVVGDS